SRYEGTNLKEIREELDEQMYNRPHMGLGNLTPFEYYAELQEAEPPLSHLHRTHTEACSNSTRLVKIPGSGASHLHPHHSGGTKSMTSDYLGSETPLPE
ncbi:MAG: hypothetical protein AAF975_09250, partial [Spirochaetota bacterium]